MMPVGAENGGIARSDDGSRRDGGLRAAWRLGVSATVFTGMLHLFNLAAWGRLDAGPLLLTPFRLSFIAAWVLLVVMLTAERRTPRLGAADAVVAAFALLFLARSAFEPETFGTAANWLVTAAGTYFLIRLGVRGGRDLRYVILAVVAAVLAISVYGLVEYLAKSNPLFDSIGIEVIGIDRRIVASDQFYRVRSFVGHPGFAAAILVAGVPMVMLSLWRRRVVMAASVLAVLAVVFLTFSRGSWLLGLVILLPLMLIRSRFWVRRNLRWVAPLVLVPVLLVAFDYCNREEAFVEFDRPLVQQGMRWSKGGDGPVVPVDGGVSPFGCFVYFEVEEDFYSGDEGPVTVVVYFVDEGWGALRVDYFARDREKAPGGSGLTPTPFINKTNSGEWSSAAFYLEDPVFDGRLNEGADFRVVDDDNRAVIGRVEVQKGRLKLPAVIIHQWLSRSASLSTRADLFPYAWDVFMETPWGMGPFNSPGTGNHAVDSLPLTWLMEFGWLSFILLAAMVFLLVREVAVALKVPRGPSTIILLSILLLVLHGGHLMILYDKPSIVMLSALTAAYVTARPRPGRRPLAVLSSDDCVI